MVIDTPSAVLSNISSLKPVCAEGQISAFNLNHQTCLLIEANKQRQSPNYQLIFVNRCDKPNPLKPKGR